jgi:D-alanyl-lipoteichoic acid acyltransferase DltB (MBOAT superfamily)
VFFTDTAFLGLFLPAFLLVFWSVKSAELKYLSVTVFSLFFHALLGVGSFAVLIISIIANFLLFKAVDKDKRWFFVSVVFNVVLLATFKCWAGYAAHNSTVVAIQGGLPIGISFFTFTQIACQYENYKSTIQDKSFEKYAAFVSFFPHLIAGPIISYSKTVPQFLNAYDKDKFIEGMEQLIIGLGKKIIIADFISTLIDPMFKNINCLGISTIDAWSCVLGYTVQLYCDFSGYCDMALGMSKMINVDLPINFNLPYRSTSIVDFWRRWHITLSVFLRDHVYIPLGGKARRYLNTIITMFISGLWHGTGFTYALWGLYHGIGVAANHVFRKTNVNLPTFLSAAITILFVIIGWAIFKTETLSDSLTIIKAMFLGGNYTHCIESFTFQIRLLLISLFVLMVAFQHFPVRLTGRFRQVAIGFVLVFVFVFKCNVAPFLYFQF